MRLIEFEAKQLLRDAGLPVPRSQLWDGDGLAPAGQWVAKAQLLTGGRGKLGLIRVAAPGETAAEVAVVRDRMTKLGFEPLVMIEEAVTAEVEYYLAWRIDDVRQTPVLMFSRQGGVDIESVSDTIHEHPVSVFGRVVPSAFAAFFREAGAEKRHIGALCRFAAAALRLFTTEDLELLEINPLGGLVSGAVIAMDAKIAVNDNALDRHGRWLASRSVALEKAELPDIERRAQERGLTFVDMEGDVALYSSGAGLGMALLDLLGDAGLKPANFVDVSGGSSGDVFKAIGEFVFERAKRDDVRAILMFFTLTATSLKSCVDSLIATLDESPPPKPLVIGLISAGAAERELTLEQARAALAGRGYQVEGEMAGAVEAVRALLQAPQLATDAA